MRACHIPAQSCPAAFRLTQNSVPSHHCGLQSPFKHNPVSLSESSGTLLPTFSSTHTSCLRVAKTLQSHLHLVVFARADSPPVTLSPDKGRLSHFFQVCSSIVRSGRPSLTLPSAARAPHTPHLPLFIALTLHHVAWAFGRLPPSSEK